MKKAGVTYPQALRRLRKARRFDSRSARRRSRAAPAEATALEDAQDVTPRRGRAPRRIRVQLQERRRHACRDRALERARTMRRLAARRRDQQHDARAVRSSPFPSSARARHARRAAERPALRPSRARREPHAMRRRVERRAGLVEADVAVDADAEHRQIEPAGAARSRSIVRGFLAPARRRAVEQMHALGGMTLTCVEQVRAQERREAARIVRERRRRTRRD